MRVVLDTNVLISSFLGRGRSHRVLEHCIHHHQVVISPFILDELREKLTSKFEFSAELADKAVALLRSRSDVVEPDPLPSPVCRDQDDDNILATAFAGHCERIITGDKDLLVLERFREIAIVSPAMFAQIEGVE